MEMMTPLAHYNLLERIGEGGIGELFRARDTKVGRTVALKIVSPAIAADPVRLGRLLEDARASARLSHPNIATLWEVGDTDGHVYLAYEFASGRSLLEESGGAPMNPRRALDLAVQIADGVAEAHSHDILHGDLRPETIMVTEKGNAKILDFGLAPWTNGARLRASAAKNPDGLPPQAWRAGLSLAGRCSGRHRPADRRVLARRADLLPRDREESVHRGDRLGNRLNVIQGRFAPVTG